jgi:hypothetical protein
MYVLLGISPRIFSIFCNIDLGRVIAILSVLSAAAVVLFILVFYIPQEVVVAVAAAVVAEAV